MVVPEKELYDGIALWLQNYIENNIRGVGEVRIKDTHGEYLSDVIAKMLREFRSDELERIKKFIPDDYVAWYIKVDIFGMAEIEGVLKFIVVEVKSNTLTLDHLAQLIGYVKVVKPELAILISPRGVSDNLTKLFEHGRLDLLDYTDKCGKSKRIHILKWNIPRRDIDYTARIPPDSSIGGTLQVGCH